MKPILTLLALVVAAVACNHEVTGLEPPSNPATETFDPSLNVNISQMTQLPGGTYTRDLVVGAGPDTVAPTTDTVWINWSGRLKTGKLFGSGTNSKFTPAGLVPGFRAGLQGMKVGGKRQLVIPSEQGYGPVSRYGDDEKILIPRQSTLIFEVELLRLHTPPPPNPES